MVRILIIENHDMVRHALTTRLSSTAGLEIVGSVGTYDEAIAKAQALKPDIILMETKAPHGLATLRDLCRTLPSCPILVLTSYPDSIEEDEVLEMGASRYLLKSLDTTELVREISSVAEKGPRTLHTPCSAL